MTDKQVYDLTENDINQYPIWYFPMDDSVEDELTVRPLDDSVQARDFQVVVRALFVDSIGKEYIGYVYWSDPDTIEYVKPVLFVNNVECITFWNGIIKPSWSDYNSNQQKIKSHFPLKYRSDAIENLPELSGSLEGLYFVDDNDDIKCIEN